jgi:toxin HigB-1
MAHHRWALGYGLTSSLKCNTLDRGNVTTVARRKLRQLEVAGRLDDLAVPPGNRLQSLKGDRAGQHAIRIDDQCRVCFGWTEAGTADVEIVDYH